MHPQGSILQSPGNISTLRPSGCPIIESRLRRALILNFWGGGGELLVTAVYFEYPFMLRMEDFHFTHLSLNTLLKVKWMLDLRKQKCS